MAETEVRGSTQIKDESIGNTQIATDAAIATTKLADGTKFIQSDGSVAMAANLPMGGYKITGGAEGTSSTDFVILSQLNAISGGFYYRTVRVATTANIATLAGGAPDPVDGVSLATNDRILVKDQSTGSQNGIYVVDTVGTGANGSWSRATDADESDEVNAGMIVIVTEGTANADTQWLLTTDNPITIDSTALTFTGVNSNYFWLNGQAGGQTGYGGTGSLEHLILNGSSDAANGDVILQSGGGNVVINTTAAINDNTPLQMLGLGTSNYVGMMVFNTATDVTNKGAMSVIGARKTNANEPFSGFGTWDNGTNRDLFIGGGTFARPDANRVYVYTAPTYTETADTGVERVGFGTSEVVFNDPQGDYDFRIEGDTNANLFFVDASTDRVGIGTSTPENTLHIVSSVRLQVSGGLSQLAFDDTSSPSNESVWAIQYGNSTSNAFRVRALNDAETSGTNALVIERTGTTIDSVAFPQGLVGINKTSSIGAQTHIVSSAAGTVGLRVDSAASPTASAMTLYNNATLTHDFGVKSGGAVVFNENQDNIDFRIEGDTNANLFFVDASTDRVGINETAPLVKTHISNSATSTTFTTTDVGLWVQNTNNTDNNWSGLVFGSIEDNGSTDFSAAAIGSQTKDHTSASFAADIALFTRGAGNLTERMRITSAGLMGVGTISPDRRLHTELDDASTNTVLYPFRITRTSSGTPVNNIGAGMEFEVETAASNNEVGAIIEVVATDTTATSEDFDIRFKTMAAGAAAANRVWINGTGLGVGASPAYELEVAGDLFVSDGLGLGQQAAAPWTPGSGEGVFWVKNDTPTTPYFTDGNGTDHQLLTTAAITSTLATREVPSGTINGVNVTFTLANTPTSGTEELYLNGVLQNAGAGNDYTISGLTITMAAAPVSGDVLLCSYWY